MVWQIKKGEDAMDDPVAQGIAETNYKRITIVHGPQSLMTQQADILLGLAHQIKNWAAGVHGGPHLELRTKLIMIDTEINVANQRIRKLAEQYGIRVKEGRRRAAGLAEHDGNRFGTETPGKSNGRHPGGQG